ncbi:MAG: histidine phosphatase family protein [Burkholderiales bacterium]
MTTKTILCVRHGESTFNAAAAGGGADPLHYDAPLSAVGRQQVRKARDALRDRPIELVVTTPLTRALQTTAGLFADHPSSPPVLVESLHRERVENSCDVGRSPALLSEAFPSFAFDHLPDVWWHHHANPDERGVCIEPLELVRARAREFRRFLLQRPERLIAVVGHGTFFFVLTGQALANCEVVEVTFED